jgi:hypothetical protein
MVSGELMPALESASAEIWAERILAEYRKSVEAIIAVGRLLIEAKLDCEHGEYLRIFSDSPNPVPKCLPFGQRSGQYLSAIARSGLITNTKHASHLPTSWMTLYELSRLPESDFIEAIECGRITPEITRNDVRKLITGGEESAPVPPPTEKANLLDLIAKTRETVRNLADEFGDQVETLIGVLSQELEVLREGVEQ